MEDSDSSEDFNINRRDTINKLEDFVKLESKKFYQKEEDIKNNINQNEIENENDIIKKKTFKEEIRNSILSGKLEYNNKEILSEKLTNIINDYNQKHKRKNYEKIPDYISKKEDNCQLVKSCANQINENDEELPLIIIENNFYDEFSLFLENYIKYKEYKTTYILKDKLLIKKERLNNYEIFHKEKKSEENDNIFFAETISTSMTDLYNENQIKDIKQSLKIISNDFKTNFTDEIKKWVVTIFNIISDYIIFNLKDKPLYYCCNICNKPIIFKENLFNNIQDNKVVNSNNELENNINNNNINNEINNIKNENNINENEKIKKRIEKKKKNDKKIIENIINDENKKLEFKNLFNVANNIINLIDFSKGINESSNHNIANPPKKKQTDNGIINNVLYYTENKFADFELIEREVSGAFVLVTDKNTLDFALKCIDKNGELKKFILLLQGQCCEKILKDLNQKNYLNKFGSCIIFTKNDKFNDLKNNYNIIKGIFKTKKEIINYINNYPNEEGIYITFKVINFKKYFDYYYEFHKNLSKFYGQLSQDLYESKINFLKEFLENNEGGSNDHLLEALKVFEKGTENKEDIIKGYTGNFYYHKFNKWLYSLDSLALEKTGYFLSGLVYSLNLYGEEKHTGVDKEITLYRGTGMHFINILPYKINVGNIITFPNFVSSSTLISKAKGFAYQIKEDNIFSVIFTINYKFKTNWIPNAFNVVGVSQYPHEEERLFQPYSFFLVKNVKIDIDNYSADIELETVGKTSVLEEEIKNEKKIWYNYKEKTVEIRNENN